MYFSHTNKLISIIWEYNFKPRAYQLISIENKNRYWCELYADRVIS